MIQSLRMMSMLIKRLGTRFCSEHFMCRIISCFHQLYTPTFQYFVIQALTLHYSKICLSYFQVLNCSLWLERHYRFDYSLFLICCLHWTVDHLNAFLLFASLDWMTPSLQMNFKTGQIKIYIGLSASNSFNPLMKSRCKEKQTLVMSPFFLMPNVQQYLTETRWAMVLPGLRQVCFYIVTYSS